MQKTQSQHASSNTTPDSYLVVTRLAAIEEALRNLQSALNSAHQPRQKVQRAADLVPGHWYEVDSSVIHKLSYTPYGGKPVMSVCFHSGAIYDYHGVAEKRFIDILNAPSIGRYFNRVFRSWPAKKSNFHHSCVGRA